MKIRLGGYAAVVNVVKAQVVEQAPGYAKTMKNYEKASNLIREIEGTLSLNPKARIDTALRKLQSATILFLVHRFGYAVKT
jgi:hypothetical protein